MRNISFIVAVLFFLFTVKTHAAGVANQYFEFPTLKAAQKENTLFRHLSIEGQMGNYIVKGETRAKKFFFTIEDGHRQLIKEQELHLQDTSSGWTTFSIPIHIPKIELPKNGTLIMNLYLRGSGGQIMSNYPLVIERFN